jgi:hypothetical protein
MTLLGMLCSIWFGVLMGILIAALMRANGRYEDE